MASGRAARPQGLFVYLARILDFSSHTFSRPFSPIPSANLLSPDDVYSVFDHHLVSLCLWSVTTSQLKVLTGPSFTDWPHICPHEDFSTPRCIDYEPLQALLGNARASRYGKSGPTQRIQGLLPSGCRGRLLRHFGRTPCSS